MVYFPDQFVTQLFRMMLWSTRSCRYGYMSIPLCFLYPFGNGACTHSVPSRYLCDRILSSHHCCRIPADAGEKVVQSKGATYCLAKGIVPSKFFLKSRHYELMTIASHWNIGSGISLIG